MTSKPPTPPGPTRPPTDAAVIDFSVTGAQRALRRAQVDHDNYIVGNYALLVGERAPIAHALVTDLKATIGRLVALDRAWHAESNEHDALRRTMPNVTAIRMPDLAIHQAIRDLGRAVDSIEPPMPRDLATPAPKRSPAEQAALDHAEAAYARAHE
jgi:hypothetical protein